MCITKRELDSLISRRRMLSTEKKMIEDEIKEIDHEIIEYILAKGELGGKDNKSLVVFGKNYKASYIEVTSRPLDTDLIKEYFGDAVDAFKTKKTSKRLDIR